MENHWYDNFLVKAVAETEHKEGFGCMDRLVCLFNMDCVVDTVHYPDFTYAVMLLFDTFHKHLGIGLELFAITVGDGVGKIHAANKICIISGQQRVVILLCGLGCSDIVFMFFAARRKNNKTTKVNMTKNIFLI